MNITMDYLEKVKSHLENIAKTEMDRLSEAAKILADQIAENKLIHVVGPGGHSNMGTQEVFFRAGGLIHINPILDEGTLLTNGALRSMAIERLPGYGKIVFDESGIKKGEVLILVNAYGINAAVIDIALAAKQHHVVLIAITSIEHAASTPSSHPARHPSKKNLSEIADLTLDCKVIVGDAVLETEGMTQRFGAISTFANAFLLNSLMAETIQELVSRGMEPPVWKSGNASGGDEWNKKFIDKFKNRVTNL